MTKPPKDLETSPPCTEGKEVDASLPPKKRSKRDRLLEAKARGADDSSAAEYAGMSRMEFDEEVATDPTLEAEMLAARAGALLKHLKSIEDASQWQAHVYALEKLWPVQFSPDVAPPADKSPSHDGLTKVVRGMRTDQLPRTPELLQNGIDQDNAKNPPPLQLPCQTTQTQSTPH